tara:strand:- start:27252 stop:27881 length:630 start_codon:yes stop_codon:yes gene_type:complete
MHWNEYLNFIIALLAIMNPLGAIPIFLGLTADRDLKEQRKTAITTGIAIVVIFTISIWIGQPLLHAFGIKVSDFQVAGGIIVFMIGLNMLHGQMPQSQHSNEEHEQAKLRESVAIIPMAIPLIAGPGAISMLIVVTSKHALFSDKIILSLLAAIPAAILFGALFFAANIGKWVGPAGIKIATRVMGLVLAAIAVSMIHNGLASMFPAWI